MIHKAKGALFGLTVGDALGSTLEFTDPDEYTDFPTLMTGPHTEMIGQGPFCLRPGQVTDDTMMALCLSGNLVANKGLDVSDLRDRYRAWVGLTHDAGQLTKRALKTSGDMAWEKSGRSSAGNGSLMRTTPIGVYYHAADGDLLIRNSIWESMLTHVDPRCVLACAAHNAAISEALCNSKVTAHDMLKTAIEGLEVARNLSDQWYPEYSLEIKSAFRDLTEDLKMAQEDDPLLYDYSSMFASLDVTDPQPGDFSGVTGLAITGTSMGFVRVAFRLAFWELLHAPSFEAGLLDIVNRGGDSDTNGAIGGALLGSLHGFDAIPDRWVNAVVTCFPGGPFDTIYHPMTFLDLLSEIS